MLEIKIIIRQDKHNALVRGFTPTPKHIVWGFTLIETLLYTALMMIVLGSVLVFTYAIITTNDSVRDRIELAENAKFIEQKLRWVITGAASINTPAINTASNSLSLQNGGIVYMVDLSNGAVRLKTGAGAPISITNEFVTVTSLSFTNLSLSSASKNTIKVHAELRNLTLPQFASTALDFYASIR